jgi:DNA-binding PadR family transcriptional regulator
MNVPKLTPKETLILRLLVAKGEMYGLELVNESRSELKRGTVYVTLSRMAEKGYIESRTAPRDDGSGPPKRLFQIAGYGARVLKAWDIASRSLTADP